jgi:hypothetical protein
MEFISYRYAPRRLISIIIAGGALTLCSMTMATEAATPESLSASEKSYPGRVGLAVSGAAAGLTTEYFEQAVTDALVAKGVFSGIDNSRTADVVMPMIGASGIFSGIENSSGAQYFLKIRILEVDTPSFSIRMTVGMNVLWTLYYTVGKTELLREKISSTYTGRVFEGGFIGANRVRAAMEGATRENIRIGIEMLATLDLEQE